MDKRVERSRALIIDAFKRLVVEQPFDSLTLSAIAREAQVDRKTLYLHFGSIDGILRAIGDEVVVGIVDEVENELSGRAVQGEAGKLALAQAFFSAVTDAVSSNILLNKKLFEAIPTDVLATHLRAPLERELMARKLVSLDVPEDTLGYYFSFVLGGLLAAYRSWLLNDGDTAKLKEVADIATKLSVSGVASVIKF